MPPENNSPSPAGLASPLRLGEVDRPQGETERGCRSPRPFGVAYRRGHGPLIKTKMKPDGSDIPSQSGLRPASSPVGGAKPLRRDEGRESGRHKWRPYIPRGNAVFQRGPQPLLNSQRTLRRRTTSSISPRAAAAETDAAACPDLKPAQAVQICTVAPFGSRSVTLIFMDGPAVSLSSRRTSGRTKSPLV